MGLFSRKKKSDEQVESDVDPVQAELVSIHARLTAAEEARVAFERRLAAIDESSAALAAAGDSTNVEARLQALDHGFGMLGEQLGNIERSTIDIHQRLGAIDARMDSADVRVDAIHHRLGQAEARATAIDDFDARLRELAERTGTPLPETLSGAPSTAPVDAPPPAPTTPTDLDVPPPPPASGFDAPAGSAPPPPPPTSSSDEADVQERLTDLRTQLAEVTEKMSSLDDRVTGISTELAHQLTELSRDIDELNRRSDTDTDTDTRAATTTGIDPEVEARLLEQIDGRIDEVLDTTEKLAAEQARYEIQFRNDLAELADRFRRPTP